MFLLAGLGMGLSFVPLQIAAQVDVPEERAGLAAGLINTSQEVGGALGVAVAATYAFRRVDELTAAAVGDAALVQAARVTVFHDGFVVGAALSILAPPGRRRPSPCDPSTRRTRDPVTTHFSSVHAIDQFDRLVAATPTESLSRPTPCVDFDVADLIDHVAVIAGRVADASGGTAPGTADGDTPAARWKTAHGSVASAISTADPSIVMDLPFCRRPAPADDRLVGWMGRDPELW